MKRLMLAIFILMILLPAASFAGSVKPVHVLYIDGQIDPAVADYIKNGINRAEDERAQAVLIIMDTPGGLLDSTKQMIQSFFSSKVPVIVYVAPSGAWAASAGAFITMAADIAAMAPNCSIGASSPVNIGPGGESQKPDETLKKKQINFTSSYARSIAEKRGRNAEWAEKFVRDAAVLTSTNALKNNVINYVSSSTSDLMKRIDGKRVHLEAGNTVTLHTAKASLEENRMGSWDSFLHYLSNPLVALVLLMATMYGIIYELANPGSILPGVIGGISLILMLYSFSVLPINAAGFAFIIFAVILFVVDAFALTHGILTFGGVVSLFFGLMMLFSSPEGLMVSLWILAAAALLTGGFFAFLISLGIKALKNPYVSGREGIVGHIGEARTDLNPTGKIFVDGSLWTATSEAGTVHKGEKVEVTEMVGLKLKVSKYLGD